MVAKGTLEFDLTETVPWVPTPVMPWTAAPAAVEAALATSMVVPNAAR